MRDDDGGRVRKLVQDGVAPGQHLVARSEFQRHHQPAIPTNREEAVAVLDVVRLEGSPEPGKRGERRRGEVHVAHPHAISQVGVVMIARRDHVRELAVERVQAPGRHVPLGALVGVDDVAGVQHEGDP